jgi:hypothetical protein
LIEVKVFGEQLLKSVADAVSLNHLIRLSDFLCEHWRLSGQKEGQDEQKKRPKCTLCEFLL